MATVEIKTGDAKMAMAIAEGATAVALRTVEAENRHLKAIDGVRREADEKRWERTRRKLARKYTVKPVGRARRAVLVAWALLWWEIHEWYGYFSAINRRAA